MRGRVAGAEKQGVQPVFGVGECGRHLDAEPPQARRADGDEQRRDRLHTARKIRQALGDEIFARQLSAGHIEIIAKVRLPEGPGRLYRSGLRTARSLRGDAGTNRMVFRGEFDPTAVPMNRLDI